MAGCVLLTANQPTPSPKSSKVLRRNANTKAVRSPPETWIVRCPAVTKHPARLPVPSFSSFLSPRLSRSPTHRSPKSLFWTLRNSFSRLSLLHPLRELPSTRCDTPVRVKQSKSNRGYLRSRGWKDFIFLCVVLVLGYSAEYLIHPHFNDVKK